MPEIRTFDPSADAERAAAIKNELVKKELNNLRAEDTAARAREKKRNPNRDIKEAVQTGRVAKEFLEQLKKEASGPDDN
ncbi:hypothetical protein D4R52_03705 [bacterium]|nr:MAG: hypothetical protein D4R52_03705 [bacterium]